MSGVTTATAATVALVASAAAAGVAAYSSYQQGQAAKAQGKYQQAVMNNNAKMAEYAAADARRRGEIAESEHALKVWQLLGRQQVTLAGSGQVINKGSAGDVVLDTAEIGRYEMLTIRSNAEREAIGYEQQGANFNAQGVLAGMKGDALAQAGTMGAISSAIGGVGSVAGKWYQFDRMGAFNTTGGNNARILATNSGNYGFGD